MQSKMAVPAKSVSSDREYVYHQLRKAITLGQLKPGERIVETSCADRFSVSRTPVREALRMLERDGLVKYTPKKGSMVRMPLTREEIGEVYDLRRQLQLFSVESTLACIDDDTLERMCTSLAACDKALAAEDLREYMVQYDLFNSLLINASNLEILKGIMAQLEDYNPIVAITGTSHKERAASEKERAKDLRNRAVPGLTRKREALCEHWAIYRALETRDRPALEKALDVHLENAKAACLAYLD